GGELFRVPLGEATGDDELLAAAGILVLRRRQDRVHRLLLGGIDEAAGVHEDDGGGVRVLDDRVPLRLEDPQHHLGIDEVLRAAQGHDVDGTAHGSRAVYN